MKVPGEMDHSLEAWKDRLIDSAHGPRIKAVVIVTESPLFGVGTQIFLGRCRTLVDHHYERVEQVRA